MATPDKQIYSTPVLGAVFKIANAYVYKGNEEYILQYADREMWWNRIGKKAMVVASFSLLTVFMAYLFDVEITQSSVANNALGIFPDLLGFGIGVFALLFILPIEFVRHIEEKKDALKFDYRILAPDMAYPLVVMAMVLVIGVLLSYVPDSTFGLYVASFALFYGLAMAIELISMIFTTGYKIMRMKRGNAGNKERSNHDSQETETMD